MCRSVGSDQTSAINGEADRQTLNSDIVYHLVIGALQECGIDRGKWFESLGSETAGKGYAVLFGDPHVETAIGKLFLKDVHTCSRGHRCGDRDDLVILARLFNQALAKNLCVLWRM